MKKRWRVLSVVLLTAVVALLLPRRDPLFHGKPESYWITNIAYFGTDEQTAQWRAFGPDGVRLLTHALDRTYGLQHTYRKAYRRHAYKLPDYLSRRLPAPVEQRSTRMCILSLLNQICRDTNFARLAEPAVARTLEDEDSGVRGIALAWYSSSIPFIDAEAKKARLPHFLRHMQDDDHSLRNNAAGALSHYREAAAIVAPVLVGALRETNLQICLTIAGALVSVDPEMAVKAGVIPIAIGAITNSNNQIAYRGPDLLGQLLAEPALSVPALAAGTRDKDDLVAISSMAALVKFSEPLEIILPALTNALNHPYERMRRYGRDALQRIQPDPSRGVQ